MEMPYINFTKRSALVWLEVWMRLFRTTFHVIQEVFRTVNGRI